MRFICRDTKGWAYFLDDRQCVWLVPLTPLQQAIPIQYVDVQINSLRRNAVEAEQEGNRRRARQLRRAALALEQLSDQMDAA
jgi:hypothetical protein